MQLENNLGKKLPRTFREFLALTDGAYLYQGDEIFGTIDNHETKRESIIKVKADFTNLDKELVPFHDGGSAYHFFDTSRQTGDGEYTIVRMDIYKRFTKTPHTCFEQWLGDLISKYIS